MTDKSYHFIDHTADICVAAWGQTWIELLKEMLCAILEVTEPDFSNDVIERKIEVESNNLENLLIDVLNEIIAFMDIHKEAYDQVKVHQITETKCKIVLGGKKICNLKTQIKSATYHNYTLIKKNDLYYAKVVYDV